MDETEFMQGIYDELIDGSVPVCIFCQKEKVNCKCKKGFNKGN